jgi:hypothetical protein
MPVQLKTMDKVRGVHSDDGAAVVVRVHKLRCHEAQAVLRWCKKGGVAVVTMWVCSQHPASK